MTNTKRWVVKATPGYDPLDDEPATRNPQTVCDIPIEAVNEEAPVYDRPRKADATLATRTAIRDEDIPVPTDLGKELLAACASPNLGSRRWIWRQYDHIVRGGTVVRPGSDAGVVRVACERDGDVLYKYLAFASDCNARMCELDAYVGGAMAVAETCRNLSCSGAEPIGLSDCLNFGNPERPEIMEQFARAIDGIAAACTALEAPIVSGNVSLYNETSTKDGTRAVLPTPGIAGVGLFVSEHDIVTQYFKTDGDVVLLLGKAVGSAKSSLSGSEWLTRTVGRICGETPVLDLPLEVGVQKLVRELCRAHLLQSAHDVSEGGLAVALAECATTAPRAELDRGADVKVMAHGEGPLSVVAGFFGEAPTRIVLTARRADVPRILKNAEAAGVPCDELGVVGGPDLRLRAGAATYVLPVAALRDARERCLEPIVGA